MLAATACLGRIRLLMNQCFGKMTNDASTKNYFIDNPRMCIIIFSFHLCILGFVVTSLIIRLFVWSIFLTYKTASRHYTDVLQKINSSLAYSISFLTCCQIMEISVKKGTMLECFFPLTYSSSVLFHFIQVPGCFLHLYCVGYNSCIEEKVQYPMKKKTRDSDS